DATWGVLAAVYGGAIHPTAEGQAAMADAALPAMREALGLPAPVEQGTEPTPPLKLTIPPGTHGARWRRLPVASSAPAASRSHRRPWPSPRIRSRACRES